MNLINLPLEIQTHIISLIDNPESILNIIVVLNLTTFYSDKKIREFFRLKFLKIVQKPITRESYINYFSGCGKGYLSDFSDNYFITETFDSKGKLHREILIEFSFSNSHCSEIFNYNHGEILSHIRIITNSCGGFFRSNTYFKKGIFHGIQESITKSRAFGINTHYYRCYNFGKIYNTGEKIEIKPGYCEAYIKDKKTYNVKGCSRKVKIEGFCSQHYKVFLKAIEKQK